jgi:hypothetical protein
MADDKHDPNEIDGCLCGHAHSEHNTTEDHDLPAAVGGVQGDAKRPRRKATRTAVEDE